MITVDFNRLDIKQGFRILDIGCGSGRHTCAAYKLKKIFVLGADLDLDILKKAKNRLELHDRYGEHGGGSWEISAADIKLLPFKDNSFDLVICSEVMEHIQDETAAINEIIRVLKPGQNLVVSVPRYFPERICWALSSEYSSTEHGHIRIFRNNELVKLVEQAGAKYWATHFAHSLHSPYWWLKCLVGLSREDSAVVNIYHRFLSWDIMKKPRITFLLDYLLNPIIGKSLVLYFRK